MPSARLSSEKCSYINIRRKHFKPSAREPVLPHQLSIWLPKSRRRSKRPQPRSSSSEPSTGRCFGIQPVNWHLSEEQITTSVLKKLQQPTIKKTSFDRLLCRNPPPPFGGSVSLALPYTVHSSPYQNHLIIVQLSVAENPPPLVGPCAWRYLIQFNRQLL